GLLVHDAAVGVDREVLDVLLVRREKLRVPFVLADRPVDDLVGELALLVVLEDLGGHQSFGQRRVVLAEYGAGGDTDPGLALGLHRRVVGARAGPGRAQGPGPGTP